MGRFKKVKKVMLESKIKDKSEYLKCLLVLSMQKITFEQELKTKYDVRDKVVKDFVDSMKNKGYVVIKQFCDIDEIQYETILSLNPIKLYNNINNISLIALTLDGETFAKDMINDCTKLISDRQDIAFTINDINNKTKAFRTAFEKISKKENSLGSRYIEYPDGTIIKRDTVIESQRQKQIKKDMKIGMLELKQELLLEHDPNSKQIAIIENKKNELALCEEPEEIKKHEYNGIYSHLNVAEIETLSQPVTNEEEKQAEKQAKTITKENMKRLEQIGKHESKYNIDKVCNKVEETWEEEKANKRECLDFLNSLESCD